MKVSNYYGVLRVNNKTNEVDTIGLYDAHKESLTHLADEVESVLKTDSFRSVCIKKGFYTTPEYTYGVVKF